MQNGTQLIKCSLATHESYKNRLGEWETETTWHRIIFWKSPKNENVIELVKGMRIKVSGKLVVNQFTDKEGAKRTAVIVQAGEMELANDEPREEPTSVEAEESIQEFVERAKNEDAERKNKVSANKKSKKEVSVA
jgi:single-strand DNA-binding protein